MANPPFDRIETTLKIQIATVYTATSYRQYIVISVELQQCWGSSWKCWLNGDSIGYGAVSVKTISEELHGAGLHCVQVQYQSKLIRWTADSDSQRSPKVMRLRHNRQRNTSYVTNSLQTLRIRMQYMLCQYTTEISFFHIYRASKIQLIIDNCATSRLHRTHERILHEHS